MAELLPVNFALKPFNKTLHQEGSVQALLRLKNTGVDYPPKVDVEETIPSLMHWLNDDEFLARWVMTEGDKAIGHIALAFPHDYLLQHLEQQAYSSQRSNGFIEIGKFFVDPYYQEHGLGHKLFNHALQYAARQNYHPALAVVETSYAAIKFYKHFGMQDVGSFEGRHGKNYIFTQALG